MLSYIISYHGILSKRDDDDGYGTMQMSRIFQYSISSLFSFLLLVMIMMMAMLAVKMMMMVVMAKMMMMMMVVLIEQYIWLSPAGQNLSVIAAAVSACTPVSNQELDHDDDDEDELDHDHHDDDDEDDNCDHVCQCI